MLDFQKEKIKNDYYEKQTIKERTIKERVII